ncbi:GntR family transcriptional regulator [Fodinicola feengrottensis]|uniref:GntR family transcriptional regulator n=2 Tax=Fodinicola feengrottensis TaxID=435914 RepID=A0ABP4UVI5_9ACTN
MADEVADRIRDAIFGGLYAPGTPLREVELAGALRVSRGPVREALLRLEREGLVRNEWHRGATVTSLSTVDADELDSLRGALEDLAVRRLMDHAFEADLVAIEETVAAMARAEDKHAMLDLDLAFHDAVFAAAHHDRLRAAWQGIRSQVHLFLLMRVGRSAAGYLEHIPAEHRELAQVLRAGNRESALTLFADHRRHAYEVFLDEPSTAADGSSSEPSLSFPAS